MPCTLDLLQKHQKCTSLKSALYFLVLCSRLYFNCLNKDKTIIFLLSRLTKVHAYLHGIYAGAGINLYKFWSWKGTFSSTWIEPSSLVTVHDHSLLFLCFYLSLVINVDKGMWLFVHAWQLSIKGIYALVNIFPKIE